MILIRPVVVSRELAGCCLCPASHSSCLKYAAKCQSMRRIWARNDPGKLLHSHWLTGLRLRGPGHSLRPRCLTFVVARVSTPQLVKVTTQDRMRLSASRARSMHVRLSATPCTNDPGSILEFLREVFGFFPGVSSGYRHENFFHETALSVEDTYPGLVYFCRMTV